MCLYANYSRLCNGSIKPWFLAPLLPKPPHPPQRSRCFATFCWEQAASRTLDGQSHTWRKQLFLELLDKEQAQRLASLFETRWAGAVRDMSPDQTFEFLPWSEASTG